MRVLVKENNAILSDLVFQEPEIHIGSLPQCQIHLPDLRVCERHARLARQPDGSWRIEHLGGSPTRVNGRPLVQAIPLHNGDQVTIADYTFNIYIDFAERHLDGVLTERLAGSGPPLPPGSLVRSRAENLTLSPDEVRSLARLAMDLAACGSIAQVMDCVIADLLQRYSGRAAWIGTRRTPRGPLEYMQGRDCKGGLFDTPELFPALCDRCLERGAGVWVSALTQASAAPALIAAPLISSGGRMGLLYIEARREGPAFSDRQFNEIMTLAMVVGDRLHGIVSQKAEQRRAAAVAESSVVQAIQTKLAPSHLPEWPDLDVAAHCTPGLVSAGDVYDIMPLPNGAAAFLLGHVNADGANAAIAMIEARTAFRIAVLHADMPHVVMREFNWLITALAEPVTMACVIIMLDPNTGAMLYCIAGRPSAVVIGRNGNQRWLDSGQAPDLGRAPGFEYNTRKGLLGRGESLAMFSGGITRLRNNNGEPLEQQHFIESLCDGFSTSARTALNETLADLSEYLADPPEDITILLAHRPA